MSRFRLPVLLFCLLLPVLVSAQTLLPYIEDPSMVEENKLPARATFYTAPEATGASVEGPDLAGRYRSLDGVWDRTYQVRVEPSGTTHLAVDLR